MKQKLTLSMTLLLFGLFAFRSSSQDPQQQTARPAKLEAMQNMGVSASDSGLPVSLPAEWGRLITVQRIDGDRIVMFLENGKGEIYLVRLLQRGQYLYLDTYDHGGVALVIRRNP
jgi:hypothetical protein